MRTYTDKQKRLLEALFTTADGDLKRASIQAGYSENSSITEITKGLTEEIAELTRKYLSGGAAKAAYALVNLLDNPSNLGSKEKLAAAKDILDRAGFGKTEKVEISGKNAMFILPAKEEKSD